MSSNKVLKASHFNSKSRSQILPHEPLLSTKHLGLKGINFDYYRCDALDVPSHIQQHHVVSVTYAQPNIERKMDGAYRHEKQNVGSTAAIPAKAEHWLVWRDNIEFALFSIKPQHLAEIAPESVNPEQVELIPTFAKSEPDPLVASLGMAIKQQLEADPDGASFYIEHLTNAFCAHLIQNYCTIKPQFRDSGTGLPAYKLKQAIDYINDNLDQRIGLEDLADLLGLSTYYLCREFRNSVGVSPYRYLLVRRVEKAKQLIQNTKLSLANIAYESGFSSQSQMTQHFRKTVGVTPKVYRNKL